MKRKESPTVHGGEYVNQWFMQVIDHFFLSKTDQQRSPIYTSNPS
ncbi:MAG TPA: hypothetical protein V6D14_14550 [Coleofasciculaceae cyanobacterium]